MRRICFVLGTLALLGSWNAHGQMAYIGQGSYADQIRPLVQQRGQQIAALLQLIQNSQLNGNQIARSGWWGQHQGRRHHGQHRHHGSAVVNTNTTGVTPAAAAPAGPLGYYAIAGPRAWGQIIPDLNANTVAAAGLPPNGANNAVNGAATAQAQAQAQQAAAAAAQAGQAAQQATLQSISNTVRVTVPQITF